MIPEKRPADPITHEAAIRIARRCRHVIQAVLREEEWLDADIAFYEVAVEELEHLRRREAACDSVPPARPT